MAFQIVQDGDTPMHVQTGEAKFHCTVEPKTCERTKIKAKGQTQRLKEYKERKTKEGKW
jgi:hypothetical protein